MPHSCRGPCSSLAQGGAFNVGCAYFIYLIQEVHLIQVCSYLSQKGSVIPLMHPLNKFGFAIIFLPPNFTRQKSKPNKFILIPWWTSQTQSLKLYLSNLEFQNPKIKLSVTIYDHQTQQWKPNSGLYVLGHNYKVMPTWTGNPSSPKKPFREKLLFFSLHPMQRIEVHLPSQ